VISYTLRSLAARRRRAAMTALAVLLGVSMISGTYIFTDTIHSAFRQLFGGATQGTSVIITSRQSLSSPVNAPAKTHVGLIPEIRELPGVAGAVGEISNVATIVGHNGKPIENTYAPTLGLSYVPPQYGRFTFVAGSPPTGPGEVAIDEATAQRQGFQIGCSASGSPGSPASGAPRSAVRPSPCSHWRPRRRSTWRPGALTRSRSEPCPGRPRES
jgi:putative ABC transport system permease protein